MANKKNKRKVYHVVRDKNGWAVELENAKRASAIASTKKEAIEIGRKLAKKHKLGQLKIHKKDGTLQTEFTYGKDPEKYEG